MTDVFISSDDIYQLLTSHSLTFHWLGTQHNGRPEKIQDKTIKTYYKTIKTSLNILILSCVRSRSGRVTPLGSLEFGVSLIFKY